MVQTDQNSLVGHRFAKRTWIDTALAIDADLCAAEAPAFEPGDRVKYSRVLDPGGDNVAAKTVVG